jgi:hypothetical protein
VHGQNVGAPKFVAKMKNAHLINFPFKGLSPSYENEMQAGMRGLR